MILSPEMAVALISLLFSAWQVYLAKADVSKKSSGLPESHFGRSLSKKILFLVDEKLREALNPSRAFQKTGDLYKKNVIADICYSS